MARPVYIVCASAGSEDKETGLISLYKIVEKIKAAPFPKASPEQSLVIIRWRPLRVVAVWMREEGDGPEDDFEHEMILHMPPAGTMIQLMKGTVKFSRPLHRFTLDFEDPIPTQGAGLLRIESRIRRPGADRWQSQDYPILTEIIGAPEADAPKA